MEWAEIDDITLHIYSAVENMVECNVATNKSYTEHHISEAKFLKQHYHDFS